MTSGPTDGRWQMRFDFATPTPSAPEPTRKPITAASIYTDEPPAPLPGEYREAPVRQRRMIHPRSGGRRSSVLPVPKPIDAAVEAGHFGHSEQGRPIRPSRQEVREITESHADTLKDHLLDHQAEPFEQGIVKYAESFGTEAAERLRGYVRHLARTSVVRSPGR